MTPRNDDLCAFRLVANLEDQRLDTVSTIETLERNPLASREDRLGVAQVEDHRAVINLLDDSGHEVTLPTLVHLVDLLAFGLTKLELHHLFERLGRDPSERLTFGRVLPLVHDVAVLIELLGVDDHLA